MDIDTEDNSDRADLLNLSNIQSLVLDSILEDVDIPESIDEPNVCGGIVDGDLSDNSWQGIYIEYLLHKILPENMKLQAKLKYEI